MYKLLIVLVTAIFIAGCSAIKMAVTKKLTHSILNYNPLNQKIGLEKIKMLFGSMSQLMMIPVKFFLILPLFI